MCSVGFLPSRRMIGVLVNGRRNSEVGATDYSTKQKALRVSGGSEYFIFLARRGNRNNWWGSNK